MISVLVVRQEEEDDINTTLKFAVRLSVSIPIFIHYRNYLFC